MAKTIQTLSPEEGSKLVDFLELQDIHGPYVLHAQRNVLIVLLLLDAGLRVGELVQLKVSDVWFKLAPIYTLELRPETTKTKTSRMIPLSDRTRQATIKYAESRHHWVFNTAGTSLFPFGTGCRPISTRQVERIVRTAGRAALGKRVHPHMLRHTFATRLMQKTNIRVVQALLGHKSLQSTQIYTHPNDQDLKKAIDSME